METAASRPAFLCRLADRTPPRWLLLLLLCAVMMGRGRLMIARHETLHDDPDGYARVAERLSHENKLAVGNEPFPTATRPPLYPLLLALGDLVRMSPVQTATLLHVVFGVATVWGVWRLGRLWQLTPGASLLAAGLVAVDPILLAHSTELMTETTAAFLVVMTLLAVTHFAQTDSFRWAAAAGIAAGLCALCRPELLAWAVAVAAVFAWRCVPTRRGARLAIYAAALVTTLAPWGARNWHVFARPVVTTTHGGFTFWLANNPDYYAHLRQAPWGGVWDGQAIYRQWEDECRAAADSAAPPDEVALDRAAYRRALEAIRAEPAMFAYASLVRVGRLWNVLPHASGPGESTSRRGQRFAVAIFYAFEFALAAVGAWFLRKKLFAAPWLWGTLLLLAVTAVHALYWTDLRMRAPLESVVALAAAYGASVLACGKPDASASLQDA